MVNGEVEMKGSIAMVGCFDTKEEEFAFLHACLNHYGYSIISVNLGVRGTTGKFRVDYEAEVVAAATGLSSRELRESNDRSRVVDVMGAGAAVILCDLYEKGAIKGVVGMGGGGGSFMILKAMQALPIGFPKLCLSTVATKDLSEQVREKDILLMPSVVDIAGLNKISRQLINHAAAAISGMCAAREPVGIRDRKKTIAISIFGNTTRCVNYCVDILESKGFEVLTFHAVGSGGQSMETLIREGWVDGVLDITTTELADEVCGGICSAGPKRLTAASDIGIPQIVVPGCLDMVNFGPMDTVPKKYLDRVLYSWAPDVTLMRTNSDENDLLGKQIADKLNLAKGKTAILIPTKGISIVSSEGGPFHDPEIDQILFASIKKNIAENINYEEIDCNINDEEFAHRLIEKLLDYM